MNMNVLCDVVNSINDNCKRLGCEFRMFPIYGGVSISLKDPNTGYRLCSVMPNDSFSMSGRSDAMFAVAEMVSNFHVGRAKRLCN